MRAVWKFKFEVDDSVVVSMPKGARILCVGLQEMWVVGELTLWAEVEEHTPTVPRTLAVRGTGHPCGDCSAENYIGTVFAGPLVWHVFDLGESIA